MKKSNQVRMEVLLEACEKGDLVEVKRWCRDAFECERELASRGLRMKYSLEYALECGWKRACLMGQLGVVKFLTTSEELRGMGYQWVDIHAGDFKDEGILWAAEEGHVEVVKFLTTSQEIRRAGHKSIERGQVERMFMGACGRGDLEMMRFLTIDRDWDKAEMEGVSIKDAGREGLKQAWHWGHLEVVRWLMESEELKGAGQERVVMDEDLWGWCLEWACAQQWMEGVRWVLNPDGAKKQWSQWSKRSGSDQSKREWWKGSALDAVRDVVRGEDRRRAYIEEGLRRACHSEALEVVKYLTTSPELKEWGYEWADLNKNRRGALEAAVRNGNLEMIQYVTAGRELKEAGVKGIAMEEEKWAIQSLCEHGHKEVMKWLVTSQELKEAERNVKVNQSAVREGIRHQTARQKELTQWAMLEVEISQALKVPKGSRLRGGLKKQGGYPWIEEWSQIQEEQATLSKLSKTAGKRKGRKERGDIQEPSDEVMAVEVMDLRREGRKGHEGSFEDKQGRLAKPKRSIRL